MKTNLKVDDAVSFTTYSSIPSKTLKGKILKVYELEYRWHLWTEVCSILGEDGGRYEVNVERVKKIK